jgi:hypothetical protein
MNITTKFSIGDEVIYWDGGSLTPVKILSITITKDGEDFIIKYYVKERRLFGNKWKFPVVESTLYANKNDLLTHCV